MKIYFLQLCFYLSWNFSILRAVNTSDSSYSISSAEVKDKLIKLDTLPSKSYIHYITPKTKGEVNAGEYKFSIQTSTIFEGTFVNIGLVIPPAVLPEKIKPSDICLKFNIKFTYPNGQTTYFCTSADTFGHIDTDLRGSGIILIEISVFIDYPEPKDHLETKIGPSGQTIPKTWLGNIKFTSYDDCTRYNMTNSNPPIILRSCSSTNTLKCVSSNLFCDGENHCGNVSDSLDVSLGQSPTKAFDKKKEICGDSSWNEDLGEFLVTEYRTMMLVGFATFCVMLAICTTCRRKWEKMRNKNTRGNGIPGPTTQAAAAEEYTVHYYPSNN